jgi:hypothetical protein
MSLEMLFFSFTIHDGLDFLNSCPIALKVKGFGSG